MATSCAPPAFGREGAGGDRLPHHQDRHEMSRRPPLAQMIDLLIQRAVAAGLTIEAVEISVDGCPRILTRRPAPGVALNDDMDWVDLAGEKTAAGRA